MNSITLKILLFSISFVILFFNPTIAFIFLILSNLIVYFVDKRKDKKKALDGDSRNLDKA
jgi:predicted membrane protein